MSSVFSKPKVVQIEPEEVEPEVVDNSEEVQELEQEKQKKKVKPRRSFWNPAGLLLSS